LKTQLWKKGSFVKVIATIKQSKHKAEEQADETQGRPVNETIQSLLEEIRHLGYL
jgi:hypothetical protein